MLQSPSVYRQMLFMAIPLMLSSLSGMAMLFCDRLILAYYSLEAHNAAVEATNLSWAFITGWISLANIIQVFVAQHYGAKQHQLLGRFIWQMIWLSVFSLIVFIPAGLWGPSLLFGVEESQELQRTYLFWMVTFGPLHILFSAFSSFFAGQGKVKIIIFVDILGNLINCVLSYLLVFGWPGILSSVGAQGAAIATNISLGIQILILAVPFFSRVNLKEFGTKNWKWEPTLLTQCIRIGLPNAIFSVLEVAGWAIFYEMMASLSENHLTVAGIVQNVLILFNFLGEGLARSVSILCGNAIGSRQSETVFKYVRVGIFLMTLFAIGLGGVLWATKGIIADWFLSSVTDTQRAVLYSSLIFGLINVVIYKYLEGIRLVIGGALTAAADTVFLLVGGSCSIWLFMVFPIYRFVFLSEGSIETALALCSLYTLIAACLYAWRFYSRSWEKNISLILEPA